uniref:KTSC domain-containing protein n=1 Tax=Globodera pallida TaxID=36090 RepID=A0A183CG37_GLOPA
MAYGSNAPVLYLCNAEYRSAFRTQFGNQANQVTAGYPKLFTSKQSPTTMSKPAGAEERGRTEVQRRTAASSVVPVNGRAS